jgi:hypothetical protein
MRRILDVSSLCATEVCSLGCGFVPSVLTQLYHPLGLKWELSIFDLQQPPQGIRVFWERALISFGRPEIE